MCVNFYLLYIYKYIFSKITVNSMQNTIHGLRFTHFFEYEPTKKGKAKKNTSRYWHRLITHWSRSVQMNRILRTSKTINAYPPTCRTPKQHVCVSTLCNNLLKMHGQLDIILGIHQSAWYANSRFPSLVLVFFYIL